MKQNKTKDYLIRFSPEIYEDLERINQLIISTVEEKTGAKIRS